MIDFYGAVSDIVSVQRTGDAPAYLPHANDDDRRPLTLTKPDPLLLKIIDPADAQLFLILGMERRGLL